ncbi:MAG: hypothetical protein FWC86_06245, partial [Coriobacteriia bacterium]|nr:hypothetical protein [Coriobacteriia bacterium]
LNYGSPTTSSSSLLYGDLKLRTPHERKLQQERRLSQGIAIGLVGLFVALILAGMFWMQYSNAHAATSSYVHQSES